MNGQIYDNIVESDFDGKFCHFILEQYKFTFSFNFFNLTRTYCVELFYLK